MDRDEYERMSPVELQLRFYELRNQIATLEAEQTWIAEEALIRVERANAGNS